jgi:hypothetical protein
MGHPTGPNTSTTIFITANPITGRSVFLDSAYAIALAVPMDQYHSKAKAIAAELLQSRTHMVTTRDVMVEVS